MKSKTLHKNSCSNEAKVTELLTLAEQGYELKVPDNCYAVNKRLAREVTAKRLCVKYIGGFVVYWVAQPEQGETSMASKVKLAEQTATIKKQGFCHGQKLYAVGYSNHHGHIVCEVIFDRYTIKVSAPPSWSTLTEPVTYDCVICEGGKSYSNSDGLYITKAEAEAVLKANYNKR